MRQKVFLRKVEERWEIMEGNYTGNGKESLISAVIRR